MLPFPPLGDLPDPGVLDCRWILYLWATRKTHRELVNQYFGHFLWQQQWNLAFCTKWIVILLKYSVTHLFTRDILLVFHTFLLLHSAVFIIFITFHFRSPRRLRYYLKRHLSILPLSQVTPYEWLIPLGNHKMIVKFTLSIHIHIKALLSHVSANLPAVIFSEAQNVDPWRCPDSQLSSMSCCLLQLSLERFCVGNPWLYYWWWQIRTILSTKYKKSFERAFIQVPQWLFPTAHRYHRQPLFFHVTESSQ